MKIPILKKQSLYARRKEPKPQYLGKDWMDNNGNGYSTKREAQVSSFLNFLRGCFSTGFTIVVGRWFWFSAFAIYPFVFIRRDHISIAKVNHEKIHVRQMLDLWIIGAYIWYPLELYFRITMHLVQLLIGEFPAEVSVVKYAYMTHSMEREARENQDNPDYVFQRKRFAFINYF